MKLTIGNRNKKVLAITVSDLEWEHTDVATSINPDTITEFGRICAKALTPEQLDEFHNADEITIEIWKEVLLEPTNKEEE